MKILIIDNYDSFTFNLYQCTGEILKEHEDSFVVDVFRNDAITTDEIKKRNYDKIIISPGPGDPSDKFYFGVCADVLIDVGQKTPVLGVCLGMQGMANYFGGKVIRAKKPMHGKTSIIQHDAKGVFKGLPQELEVMRYHSLVAERESLPACLEISAVVAYSSSERSESRRSKAVVLDKTRTINGEIMGLRHTKYPIEGVQFHPESFATEAGKLLLTNFLFGGNH